MKYIIRVDEVIIELPKSTNRDILAKLVKDAQILANRLLTCCMWVSHFKVSSIQTVTLTEQSNQYVFGLPVKETLIIHVIRK